MSCLKFFTSSTFLTFRSCFSCMESSSGSCWLLSTMWSFIITGTGGCICLVILFVYHLYSLCLIYSRGYKALAGHLVGKLRNIGVSRTNLLRFDFKFFKLIVSIICTSSKKQDFEWNSVKLLMAVATLSDGMPQKSTCSSLRILMLFPGIRMWSSISSSWSRLRSSPRGPRLMVTASALQMTEASSEVSTSIKLNLSKLSLIVLSSVSILRYLNIPFSLFLRLIDPGVLSFSAFVRVRDFSSLESVATSRSLLDTKLSLILPLWSRFLRILMRISVGRVSIIVVW